MITQAQEKKIHTPEEYLAFEISSDTRHEYINEEVIPMTGGTPEHNEIASIFNAILRVSLKGQPYSIFIADQRLWIPDRQLYTYPAVMVAQRPIELQAGRKDTIINPILIAEVLSKSTKSYDRDEKFSAYRIISTFQEYLLIDQYTLHVERYFKATSNQWIFSEYDDTDACIELASIACKVPLADLYSDIEFEAK